MTKRISQPNTVVVPAVHADGVDGKVVATKAVVVPAEAEVATAKVEVKADEAPVTVVADPVAALVAPAPMAMVAEPVAAAEPAAASASSAQESDDGGTDLTPYIVGGVLVLGGVLAVALSSGDTDPIAVTPAPTNTAPNFTSATTATIAENAPVATIVYDANASDTQNNAIVFSIGGTDAALFNFDTATGVVTLKASANFEAKSSYSFTVTATDNGSPVASTTQTVTVTVTNVAETPTFASATATATTPENIPTSTVVFTATATDPDAVAGATTPPAGSVITYTISGTDAAAFNINATNGQVTFKASPDFEAKATYNFTVTATDNTATTPLSSSQTVTLTVTDVAENPTFTSGGTAIVAENAVTTTVVYDANTATPATFTLGGADAAAFNIDAATGIVTLKASADFETKATYNITVTATGGGGTSVQPVVVTVTNVNEAPTFAAGTRTTTVAENVAAGSTVFTAGGATDADAGAVVTYTLTGTDAAAFAVNATTGAVSFVASPNFEAKSSFSFNLVATDQAGLTTTQANTVTVTNVNEAPTFAAATGAATIAENGAANAVVYTATATDVDAGATLTYSLTGADAALFTVNPTTGAITLTGSANFEAKPSYSVNLVATDQGGLTASQAVTITVTNVNEAPTVAVPTAPVLFLENSATTTTVFTATAADVDAGATRTFSLTGPDAALFAISATGAVTFRASPNFEATPTKTSYSVSVVVTDQGGLTATSTPVTVTLGDVNEAPVFATPTATATVAENVATTATVFTAAATDVDSDTILTYTISGADAALFNINATTGAVTFKASPNFEATPTKTSFNFTVTATDDDVPSLNASQTVTLNLTNVNEAPVITSGTTATATAENGAAGAVVYTATATDPEANAVTFSLGGADAASFAINATTGVVTLIAPANFEAKATYSFTVTATDNANPALSSPAQTVTLGITNVNEAPTFAVATQSVTFAENVTAGTTVLTATATDVDAGATRTYTLTGTDAAAFAINATTGVVTFVASPNFEAKSSYSFNVVATDQGGLTATQAETVTITNVNEAPAFAAATATATVAENGTANSVVFTGAAVDPDAGAVVTYSLTGTDAALFTVNAATGAVTLTGAANFEAKPSYSFNLVATDQGGLTGSQAVTLNVTNVNEAPTFAVATQSVTFAENVAAGTTVLTATATDVDAGATRTYTLTGTDAAAFAINATTGVVTFVASPNFEAKSSYSFNVVATDQGGLTATQAETVTITNVNEAPAFAAATATATVAENGTANSVVFTGTAVDPDAGAVVTYSLTGTDAALFTVNAATGAVTLTGAANFEAKPSYSFNLVATDQGGLSNAQAVTLGVTNVNEVPTFAAATRTAAIDENVAIGTVVPGSATAIDPDAGAVVTYSLSGVDAARFTINATTGVVALAVSPDFETKAVYNFGVVATDQGGLSSTQTVTLNINDLPEGVRIDGAPIPAGSNTNFSAAVGNVTFLESAAVGNITTISNFTSGDIIQTDVATSAYSFGAQGNDLIITLLSNGINSQITLTGAAGNNFIFNEASAEAAVGFDFFRSSIPPAPPASGTIDGPGVQTFNAANASNTYTDNSAAGNTTTITNFTSDDRIVVTGVNGSTPATTYSFGAQGNDLVITFLQNGINSQTTLVGVANPGVFVFDEASAELSVGFDFFRYG